MQFLSEFVQLVISPQSKSFMRGSNEFNCISFSNAFRTKTFLSLVERRVQTENPLSTFAVEGVINIKILSLEFNKNSFVERNRSISHSVNPPFL